MIETMLAVAGVVLIARYAPRRWRKWKDGRDERKRVRQQRRDVQILAPTLHRSGMSPEITFNYLNGTISFEEWRTAAIQASKEMQEHIDWMVHHGASPEVVNGYINGIASREEFLEAGYAAVARAAMLLGSKRTDE
jgi:hypothetical protein